MLAAACNFVQLGDAKFGDSTINVEALGVVGLVHSLLLGSVGANLSPVVGLHR